MNRRAAFAASARRTPPAGWVKTVPHAEEQLSEDWLDLS
ncbi:hypothetical protein SAMN05421505_111140 [Sinosporangium album]|uniref:Uncharacterized protein n=1 Tax=Sinosporangium album TaxID=504805 RepID=A0A1G7ZNZ4_9ACTN|nr:hypothetical protein SAMN05421505_111140 [Sinosporangium album]